MIEVRTSLLVPGWVHEGFFPEADEEKLGELAGVWSAHAATLTERADDLDADVRRLDASFTGPTAEAARARTGQVRQFLTTTRAGCRDLAEMIEQTAKLVTFAKTSINTVLLSLQVETIAVVGAAITSPPLTSVIKLRQLQIAAQAQIKGIHTAVVERIGALSVTVDIQPPLTMPTRSASKFAPGSQTSLFAPGLGAVAPTSPVYGGSGTPEAPVAGPGEEGATTPPLLSPGSIVGGDQQQGPEPGTEPGGPVPVDGVLSPEEQAAIAANYGDEIDQGATTTGYDGQDLAGDAGTVPTDGLPLDGLPLDDVPGGGPLGEGPLGGDGPDQAQPDPGPAGSGPGQTLPPPDLGGGDQARPGPAPTGTAAPPESTPTRPEPTTSAPVQAGFTPDPPAAAPSGPSSYPQDYRPSAPAYVEPHTEPRAEPTPEPDRGPDRTTPAAPDRGPGPGIVDTGPVTAEPVATQPAGTSAAGIAPPATGSPLGVAPGGLGSPGPTPFAPGGNAPIADPGQGAGGGPGGGGPSSSGPGGGVSGSVGPAAPPAVGPSGGVSGGGVPGGGGPVSGPVAGGPGGPVAAPPAGGPGGGGAPGGPGAPGAAAPPTTGAAPGAAVPPAAAPAPPAQPAGQPAAQPQPPAQLAPASTAPRQLPGVVAPPTAEPEPEPTATAVEPEPDAGVDGAALLMAGALPLTLAPLLRDLGRPAGTLAVDPRSGLTLLPTQFGPGDQPLATRPPGMGVAYQKVLSPGEAEALLSGQETVVRGLIHPLDQVVGLDTPAALRSALGLDVSLVDENRQTVAAYDRAATEIEVLRFTGVRDADLVIPVQADVTRPDSPIPPLVREHQRPWTGSGEAPGSTADHLIEEFELLGELCHPVPHLAEIWRLDADGGAAHVATFNARTGGWSGAGARRRPPPGTRAENGHVALVGAERWATVNLSAYEQVLIAWPSAGPVPDGFAPAADGSARRAVDVDIPEATIAVVTVGRWRGARVTVLQRTGSQTLIDYAGGSPAEATDLGLRQLGQGHWQQRWVPTAEVTDVAVWERPYPALPADSGPTTAPDAASHTRI